MQGLAIQADWTLVTGPLQEPLTVATAKRECRVDVADEDDRIAEYINASRRDAEAYLSRGLFTQTRKLVQDDWTDEIWLPMAAPLGSVTSVKYYASNGTLTTLATTEYEVKTDSEPGRVVRAPDKAWPTLQSDKRAAIEIVYVVGWTEIALIPSHIRYGIAVLTRARFDRLTGPEWESAWQTARNCFDLAGRVWWRQPVCSTY